MFQIRDGEVSYLIADLLITLKQEIHIARSIVYLHSDTFVPKRLVDKPHQNLCPDLYHEFPVHLPDAPSVPKSEIRRISSDPLEIFLRASPIGFAIDVFVAATPAK